MKNVPISWEKVPILGSTSSDIAEEGVLFPIKKPCLVTRIVSVLMKIGTAALWALGCFFLYLTVSACTSREAQISPVHRDQLTYSPAQDAIRYKEQVFTNGFTETSRYQGPPSKELDRAWWALYTHMTRIPPEDAAQLENTTVPIPGDPDGYYGVIFDVFHSLHCLDELRKHLWPDHYKSFAERYHVSQEVADMHMDHCVDAIRQSLMCHADVSTITFNHGGPNDDETDLHISGGHVHTCRDWEAIEEYVAAHEFVTPMRPKRVEDIILGGEWVDSE
ncbi:hypothetical protein PFICI_03721 [Pestalotiopsis fici W106-1]|uniref:Uncharacterized protein n=1 Tax=Pestalotiopsis fici (strain W106-1 / CGMCC3.15140) TaxID=1229662 RepID=W3XKD5_PESFW|nr:uncharacterized protein PFICI_03721 [Pestalotiopsis fici W106-1]ETS85696.1 hypothetical protein PFICI_03721 [Pestalotiopsis fici W106-1]